MSFLGYIIEQGNLRPNPVKVKAMEDWPKPTDLHQCQHFLGFANFYRHFMRDVSKIASPLTRLRLLRFPFSGISLLKQHSLTSRNGSPQLQSYPNQT